MDGYKKNDRVFIRDYPFGSPTNISGEIVGVLGNDCFNVKIKNGWNEVKIISFKYWKLIRISEIQENSCKNEKETVL